MIRVVVISALLGGLAQCEDASDTAEAEEGASPSGMTAELQDVRYEPEGAHVNVVKLVRLRYVLPQIGGPNPVAFETIEPDFKYLCETDGLAHRAKSAPNAEEIVISIASAPVAFGEIAPEIVQYFDAFEVRENACIWGGLQ